MNQEALLQWAMGNDAGISSKTIMSVMTGTALEDHASVPWDADDFGRCYRLLNIFPEWKSRLQEVADKYPEWQKLVDNWDKLTEIYERETKNKDGRAPELYRIMSDLLERNK